MPPLAPRLRRQLNRPPQKPDVPLADLFAALAHLTTITCLHACHSEPSAKNPRIYIGDGDGQLVILDRASTRVQNLRIDSHNKCRVSRQPEGHAFTRADNIHSLPWPSRTIPRRGIFAIVCFSIKHLYGRVPSLLSRTPTESGVTTGVAAPIISLMELPPCVVQTFPEPSTATPRIVT
jgi:hypothetical protein